MWKEWCHFKMLSSGVDDCEKYFTIIDFLESSIIQFTKGATLLKANTTIAN